MNWRARGFLPFSRSLCLALLAYPAGALFLFLASFFAFVLPYIINVFEYGHHSSSGKNPVSYLVHFSTSFLYFNYNKAIYNSQ